LWSDKSADGIKTGYTDEAKYCLVASAERDGMRLISVVMGAANTKSREQETQKLFTYGFRYFETHQAYKEGESIAETKVWAGKEKSLSLTLDKPLILTIPRGKQGALDAVMEIDSEIVAPVKAGASYGVLKVSLDGAVVERRPLIAAQPIEQAGLFTRLWDSIVLMFRGLLGIE